MASIHNPNRQAQALEVIRKATIDQPMTLIEITAQMAQWYGGDPKKMAPTVNNFWIKARSGSSWLYVHRRKGEGDGIGHAGRIRWLYWWDDSTTREPEPDDRPRRQYKKRMRTAVAVRDDAHEHPRASSSSKPKVMPQMSGMGVVEIPSVVCFNGMGMVLVVTAEGKVIQGRELQ